MEASYSVETRFYMVTCHTAVRSEIQAMQYVETCEVLAVLGVDSAPNRNKYEESD
jgi:hypothetical protein